MSQRLWTPEQIFEKHPAIDHQILNNWHKDGKLPREDNPDRHGYFLYPIKVVDRLMSEYRVGKPEDAYDEEKGGRPTGRHLIWIGLLESRPGHRITTNAVRAAEFQKKFGITPHQLYVWERDGCRFMKGEKPGIVTIKFIGDKGNARNYVPEGFLVRAEERRKQAAEEAIKEAGQVIDDTKGYVPMKTALGFFSERVLTKFALHGRVKTKKVMVIRAAKRKDGTVRLRQDGTVWLRAAPEKWFCLRDLKEERKKSKAEHPGWRF